MSNFSCFSLSLVLSKIRIFSFANTWSPMYVIRKYLLKTDYLLGILLCTEDTNVFKVKALLNDKV